MPVPTDKSIVVLPFVNRSPDPADEFFSDGITEEIIHALGRVSGLRVIARTSAFAFKGQALDVREIAQQLEVSNLLEGSVRRAGERVRITARLLRAADGSQLWSGHFDRQLADIFALQDEISLLIVEQIREELGHLEIADHLLQPATTTVDSYLLLLQANHLFNKWNPVDVRQAIDLYEEVLADNAQSTAACLGLADAYGFMATTQFLPVVETWAKSRHYTEQAFALAPQEAGVHYQRSQLAFFVDCDFRAASRHAQRSLQLQPNYPEAQQFMAFLYMLCGAMSKAKEHLTTALTFDPLNQETLFYQAYYAYRSGDYTSTDHYLSEILAQNDKNIPAISLRQYLLLVTEQYDALAVTLDELPEEVVVPDDVLGLRCLLHFGQYGTSRPNPYFESLQRRAADPTAFQAHSFLFLVYARLGQYAEAFARLEENLTLKSPITLLTFSDPLAADLRPHPRYQEYHRRLYQIEEAPSPQLTKKDARPDPSTQAAWTARLLQFVDEAEPYLNPKLTLRELATLVDIHPNQLSWLLNESLGKNFNTFVNQYRVAHFKKLAANPRNRHISLEGLGYESGFNSKSVFFTFFKKEEGMTPNAYLKNLS